nr:hypothetical protein [uncultured Hyphomonas sp.]
MKFSSYLALAALSVAVCGQPAIAQSPGNFGTGAWTDTSFVRQTMPDGTETEQQSSSGSVCIDAGNNTLSAVDQTFLKTYADRQCVISEENYSSTGDLTTMDAHIICGPLSGNLRVHYAFNLVRVSSSFEVETGAGITTIFNSSRWQRSGDGC